MTKIAAEMQEIAVEAKVFVLATATKDGKPNAVPIAFARVFSDDEILLMDNFMRKTRQILFTMKAASICICRNESSR